MNIGEFKSTNGRLMGSIATRTIDLPKLGLRSVDSTNDKAPVYEVVAFNVGGRWVQIGALWEATSNSTGEVFLQGSLDDPSLPEPLPIALFGSEDEGYRVAWRRAQRRDDFAPVNRAARRDTQQATGFGDSTADTEGRLQAADVDDEVPF